MVPYGFELNNVQECIHRQMNTNMADSSSTSSTVFSKFTNRLPDYAFTSVRSSSFGSTFSNFCFTPVVSIIFLNIFECIKIIFFINCSYLYIFTFTV